MPKSRRQRSARKVSAPSSTRVSTQLTTRASTCASHSLAASQRDLPTTDSIVVGDSRPSASPREDPALPEEGPAPSLSEILQRVQAEMQAIQRGQTPAPAPQPTPSDPCNHPLFPRDQPTAGMVRLEFNTLMGCPCYLCQPHVCMCGCMHGYACTHVYGRVCVCVCVRVFVHVCVCLGGCMSVRAAHMDGKQYRQAQAGIYI